MAHASPEALQPLQALLRQLREIKSLKEVRPGIFYSRGAAFLHFHDEGGSVAADLKKPGGSGFDRFAVDTAPAQRRLVDAAKLRAGRHDDD